ncbi:phosphoribosyltransferase-like protein [Kribbella sp. NPDC004138]
MTQSAHDAARDLFDGRARVLRPILGSISSRYESVGESQLVRAVGVAGRNDRPLIGFLLVERVLQRAFISGSRAALTDFMFRFGSHLRASLGLRGLSAPDRIVLASAALELFSVAPSHRRQREEVESILDRLPDLPGDAGGWRRQFGMEYEDFRLRVGILSASITRPEPAHRAPEVPATRPSPESGRQTVATPGPPWLALPAQEEGGYASGSRNWPDLGEPDDPEYELGVAWALFEDGKYAEARDEVWDVYVSAGRSWRPTTSPDGARTWNWLRLLWLLAENDQGLLRNRRRALLSAAEAAKRSVPSDNAILEWLTDNVLRDYVAATPQMQANWAVHAARSAITAGGGALSVYDNDTKGQLRDAWSTRFGSVVEQMRQTHQMVEALASEFKFLVQELTDAAKPDSQVHRRLHRPLRRIEVFLDEDEQKVVESAIEGAARVGAFLGKESTLASDSNVLFTEISGLIEQIATSESLLLQDTLGPAFQAMLEQCAEHHEELSSGSRPNITVELLSSRLPLSSGVRAPFTVDVALRNDGNATAELIEVTLSSDLLVMESAVHVVERIAPGAERVLHYVATSRSESASIIEFSCEVTWRDPLEQVFHAKAMLRAEDQRQAAWQIDDVNPFKLGTISAPDRLVGRADDLDALERIMAGGGSAATTGLKRVGKTSLAKTLMSRLRADGWAVQYLPLGQVLTGKSEATELVTALVETIYDAVLEAGKHLLIPEPPVISDDSNIIRRSGRWIRQVANVLTSSDQHVLVALDDFDELPRSLYEGAEANALFLFLRSIIDEPWLSLMFIGSEVLPAILSAQAHKLNQVTAYVVSNFQTVDATRELLERPTTSRLEWQEAAFSRAHFLAGGNPYYLTLLGQEVWQRMRELDRTYVGPGEVDDAMQRVAESASASHFMHLWADSTAGMDGRARSALMTGAVLRGIAQASGEAFALVAVDDAIAIAAGLFVGASKAELLVCAKSLIDRGVVLAEDQALRLSIPLASAWLRSAGSGELDRQLAIENDAGANARMFSNIELVRLTQNVVFCAEPVSEVRLGAWLEQFPADVRYLAFKVAERLLTEGYFSATRMTQEVLPALKSGIMDTAAWSHRKSDSGGYAKNAYVLQHGIGGASSHAVATTLTKLLRIKKTNVVTVEGFLSATKSISAPSILLVADDLAGTGTQLRNVATDAAAHFTSLTGPWRENLHVIVAAGLSATRRLWESDDLQVENVVAVDIDSRLKAFDENAGIFESDQDRELAADVFDAIGRSLSSRSPRGWGDLGLLVATDHNCPNNTLPAVWKPGRHAGDQWLPLLERRL